MFPAPAFEWYHLIFDIEARPSQLSFEGKYAKAIIVQLNLFIFEGRHCTQTSAQLYRLSRRDLRF